MTARPPGATRAAVLAAGAVTIAVAAVCWLVTVDRASGMDMGTATRMGSFGAFLVSWVLMMAAMMLPGAIPEAVRRAHRLGPAAAAMFVGCYLAVWAVAGVAGYVVYRPHGAVAAGAVVVLAGLYELSPMKRHCRSNCGDGTQTALGYGLCCVGSSCGLMMILLALGPMSPAWMALIALVALAQKVLPTSAALDVPLALAISGLGVVILIAPSTVPGVIPGM